MTKLRMMFFAIVGILATSMTALAQAPIPFKSAIEAAENEPSVLRYKAIAAVFGFAIAVAGGAIGQSRIAAAAVEGAARNPGAAARIQTMMILGLALIESLVLFALLITFMKA